MTLIVNAHIHAAPGKREALKSALQALVAPTRAEAGCNAYDLHEDQADETHFMFQESWVSREALDTHMASDHIAAFRTASEGLIADFKLYELTKLD